MRTSIVILAAAALFAGCSSGTRVVYVPAPAAAEAPVEAPPVGVAIVRADESRLLVSTNQPAYIAVFEVLPNRGVTLVYPRTARQRQAYHSGSRWLSAQWSPEDGGARLARDGGGLGGMTRRATPPTTRYVYALASERPLRITDRSFDDDYMRFALGARAYRAEDPYETMEAISRHFLAAQREEDWGEDLLAMDLGRSTRPARISRVYCSDGSVIEVRDEIADHGWCPPRARRGTAGRRESGPRADSVVASSGRPVARQPQSRMRPEPYRVRKPDVTTEPTRDAGNTSKASDTTGGARKGHDNGNHYGRDRGRPGKPVDAGKKDEPKGDAGNHYGRDTERGKGNNDREGKPGNAGSDDAAGGNGASGGAGASAGGTVQQGRPARPWGGTRSPMTPQAKGNVEPVAAVEASRPAPTANDERRGTGWIRGRAEAPAAVEAKPEAQPAPAQEQPVLKPAEEPAPKGERKPDEQAGSKPGERGEATPEPTRTERAEPKESDAPGSPRGLRGRRTTPADSTERKKPE